MFDLLLAVILLFAIARALRQRSTMGALCGAAAAVALTLLVLMSLAGWYGGRFFNFGMANGHAKYGMLSGVWVFFLLGPAVLPGKSGVPLSAWMEHWTLLCRLLIVALCGAGAILPGRAARREVFESDAAHRLEQLSVSFVACTLAATIPVLLFALGDVLSEP